MSKAVIACADCATPYDKRITQSVFCAKCKAKVEKANNKYKEEKIKV